MAPTLDTRYVLQLKTSFFGMLPRKPFACEDDAGRAIRNLTAVEFPYSSLDDRVERFITTKTAFGELPSTCLRILVQLGIGKIDFGYLS